jgi:hypothetical protein
MLEHFQVAHHSDGKTVCRIYVEPNKKTCSVIVTVDRRIVCQADETDASFRSATSSEWTHIQYWDDKAARIAKAWSPFWKGESAA